MRSLLITLLFATGTTALAADDAKPPPDQELIQGTWRIVKVRGREAPEENEWRGGVITFTADAMTIKPRNAQDENDWTQLGYTLGPGQTPKHFDTRHRLGRNEKPIVQSGIYAFEKGRLKFTLNSAGKPRPTSFDGVPLVFELERVQAGEKTSGPAGPS